MKNRKNKYRFTVGVCGGSVLHSNIIKAETPEAAARIYLDSLDKPYAEADVNELVKHATELTDNERVFDEFMDVKGKTIKIGDQVVFADRYEQYLLRISVGKVVRVTKAKVFISTSDGNEKNFVADEKGYISRIALLPEVIESSSTETVVDALGQSIDIGDEIIYLGSFRTGSIDSTFWDGGRVETISKDFVYGDKMSGKKKSKSIVVVSKK